MGRSYTTKADVSADHSTVRLTLLERFAVSTRSTPILLPCAAQRLVALLALHTVPMSRSRVAGTLWPESTGTHAMSCLRSLLWRIRRPKAGLIDIGTVTLAIAPAVEVDYWIATAHTRALLERRCDTTMPVGATLLQDLLPDWEDEWVILERERFRELRLRALEAECEDCTITGRYARAVEAALTAVQIEPLRDSAHRLLIAAHLAEGNRVAALRHYRRYCAVLRKELGLGPAPAVETLMKPLLDGSDER